MSHRANAHRTTRLAQAGTLVLAGSAAALAVLPIGEYLSPEVPKLAPIDPTAKAQEADPAGPDAVDGLDVGSAISALTASNPRKQKLKPEVPDKPSVEPVSGETAAVEPVDIPVAPGEWRYLGSVVSPRSVYALIGSEGEQFLLAKGTARAERTLEDVQPDHITLVEANGERVRIDLLPPTITWPEVGPGRMNPAAVAAAPRPANGGAFRPINAANSGVATGARPGAPNVYYEVPGRPGPGAPASPATMTSVNGVDTGSFPAEINIDSFDTFVRKVSANDFEAAWAESELKSLGLEPGATFEQQLEYFQKLGLTLENNGDFFQNLSNMEKQAEAAKEAVDQAKAPVLNPLDPEYLPPEGTAAREKLDADLRAKGIAPSRKQREPEKKEKQ